MVVSRSSHFICSNYRVDKCISFPAGHPHSLQGLSPNGTEFLLIFDDGGFSEDSTFLLTDWLGE